jgi:hypothetical protein
LTIIFSSVRGGLCHRSILGLILSVGFATALLAPTGAAEVEAAARGPVLAVPEHSQDGGTVEQGTVVRYRFTVANHGQVDLELKQVKPSCGCTVLRAGGPAPGKGGW